MPKRIRKVISEHICIDMLNRCRIFGKHVSYHTILGYAKSQVNAELIKMDMV